MYRGDDVLELDCEIDEHLDFGLANEVLIKFDDHCGNNRTTTKEDDSSDDDDDGITVITNNILSQKTEEIKRIDAVIAAAKINYDDNENSFEPKLLNYNTNIIQTTNNVCARTTVCSSSSQINLTTEIEQLCSMIVNLNTTKVIAVFINAHILLIPYYMQISNQLKNLIWFSPFSDNFIPNTINSFRYQHVFENVLNSLSKTQLKLLNGADIDDKVIAFFGARYIKPTNNQILINKNLLTKHCPQPPNRHRESFQKFYIYSEFTLIIMKNKKLLDYTIHGINGNITALIEKYNPSQIFYAGLPHADPLEIFLNYNYQPFAKYKHLFQKISITSQEKHNVVQFCERCDQFCSFCQTLHFVINFFKQKSPTELQPNRHIYPTTILEHHQYAQNYKRYRPIRPIKQNEYASQKNQNRQYPNRFNFPYHRQNVIVSNTSSNLINKFYFRNPRTSFFTGNCPNNIIIQHSNL